MSYPTSTNMVWRCHVPAFLSHPWRHARSPFLPPGKRVDHVIALVDALLRYLVAVLSVESLARGVPAPGEYLALCQGLRRPTLGSWCAAAFGLARASVQYTVTQPLLPYARLLAQSGEDGVELTGTAERLRTLIAIRNEIAHGPDGRITPGEADAEKWLERSNEALRGVLVDLHAFRTHPLCYVESRKELRDRRHEATVVRLGGLEAQPFRVQGEKVDLPEREAFLLSPEGHAFLLSPFVRIEPSSDGVLPQARLFYRLSNQGQARYPDHRGQREVCHSWVDPRARSSSEVVRVNAVSAEVAREVREGFQRREAPELPGYQVTDLLGRGASSVVYRAVRENDGEPVALKVLHEEILDDPIQRRRLDREFSAMRALSSPFTVRAVDLVDDDRHGPVAVMEMVDGIDLRQVIGEEGPLPPARAAELAIEVLRALDEAHRRDIFHRDVKPGNVIVDREGHARLVDFGIAYVVGSERLTRTLDAVGTTLYAAPEQLAGGDVDARADLYAVGRLLEEMVGGVDKASCPNALRSVIRRATSKSPGDRYPDAAAMIDAVHKAAHAKGWNAPFHAGELVGDAWRIRRDALDIRPGFWLQDAVEVSTGQHVWLLSADNRPDPRQILEQAVASAPPAALTKIGYRAARATPEGFYFVVFQHRSPRGVAERLCREVSTTSTPGPVPERTKKAAKVAVPLVAAGTVVGGLASVAALAGSALMGRKIRDKMRERQKGRRGPGGRPGRKDGDE